MSSLEHSAEALQRANGRIQAFTRKFKRGHLYLAYHAAFPLALNPDMVYRIWANFQHDEWGQLLQIPWIAVADLLLSNLCEEVGHELYQMDLAVRDTLLGELVANPGLGQPRLRQLARFLEDYVEAEMKGTDAYEQRLAQSQKWVAQAYQGRETAVAAAQSIAATLKQNEQSPLEVARLSSLVQQIRQPLQEAGFKNLVQYGQVAWTLVHGDEDGRSRIAASNIVTSGAQVGDVVLMPPPHVTPPPISATTTESDELDVVETMRVEGPTSVSPNELFKLVVTVPNVGQMDWTADYFLLVSGEGIEPMEYLLPSTPAGTAATLTVELAAAEADGRYRLQLQVQNSQGDLLEKATAFDFRVVTRRGKQAIEDEEAYRFIFEGGQGFENDFSVAEAELQDLTMALKGSLRRIAWGDAEPFGSGKAYRYGDGRMDEERLRVDLGQLALQGMRAHDAIFPQIEGGINALDMKFGWDLMVGMSQPGVVQIASRTGRRLLIPAALFYDYPLDDGRRLAEYRLCDVFVTAVRRGQPLQETVCFQGDCPAYDDDEEITICPSGFWGFRHSLGMPLVSSSLTDASMTIQHEGDPQIAMSVATDAGFRYRQQHEAALRSMGLLRGEYADSREATIELMKQSVAEVVYFFCFGGLEEDGTPFMRVGSPDEGAITAMTLLAEDVYWEGKRPFIFMNGVDTTAFASEHALDLVRTFTDASGAAGVMGIEITVFEQLAVAFAEAFLQHFMVEGRTAGEAIRAARLALLQQGNPLGLVYTLYALPDLRLEQVFAPIEEPLEELAPRFVEPFDFRERIERKLAAGPADEGALVAIDAWRQNPEGERFFLVTGEEGSGKGELVAQLAQQDWVGAVHFFLADDEWTMNWDGLYKSLAAQLGNRYEDYGRSLQEVVQEQERRQQITQKAVPSEVLTSLGEEGIQLELDPTTLLIDFDVYIRKPLAQMWLANSAANVVMVLDGWDVAAVGAPEENVAELLAAMSELPLNVRWVMTLRPLPEMLDVIRPLGVVAYRLTSAEMVEGWASAAFLLIAESGDVAQVGEFGINLRAEPARTAVVLGRVKAGSQVTVLGEASGEYVPVTVLQSDLVAGEQVSESAEDGLSWEVATKPLYRLMAESFDLEEFYTLCFELSLDYEDLAGQTKSSKALELQRTMMRTGRVSELLAALARVRPYLNLRPYLFMILVATYRSDQDVERLFRGFGLPVRDFPEPERFAWGSEAWREEKLKGLQQWVVENGRLPELVQRVQAKGADLSFYELPEPTTMEAESQPVADFTDFRTIAYDPKLFVNRETKFRGFRKLLEPRTRQQMMLIEAEKDMGKSWLLRHMQNHCRQEQIPVALVNLGEEDLENSVVLVERMIRQLGEGNFSQLQTFMQELGLAERQFDLSRVASSEKEQRDLAWRVSNLFFDELERLAGRTAVSLFFDSYENSPEAVGRWLTDELVARLSQSDLSHVIVIITGRRIPELDFAKHIVVQTGLELFTEEHVKEYLFDRRQLMDIDLRTVYLTSGGVPGLLAKMADAASVAINHPDDTDIYEALLAEISEDAATVVNMAANDGVDDFFATLEETQSASVEAEQASPTDEPWPAVPWPGSCPIIAIHSYHGGVGKTQIAVNLGAVLAQSGLRVGIMETNLQAPRMHQVFGITGNKFWLNDYLWGQCDIKETVADVSGQAQIVQENGRLFVISANSEPAHIARMLREGYDVGVLNDGMSDFIESLTLDVLLAESQSGIQEETLLSLAICDAALIVLRANRQEMSATESLLEIIRKLDVPQVIFAVNQLPASTNAQQFKAEVEEEFGLPVVGLLPLTDDLLVTQSEGLFVVNQPHNPWSRSLKQMTVSLGNMLSASS